MNSTTSEAIDQIRGAAAARIMDTAERLWAAEGIDAVSLNRIRAAAGERNRSAIQYHFESKENLVSAVLARRQAGIDRERLAMLAKVDMSERASGFRGIAEALIRPFAAMIDTPCENHYVRFTAQIFSEPRWRFSKLLRGKHDRGLAKAVDMAQQLLGDVPREIVRQRLQLVMGFGIYTLADWERARLAGKPVWPKEKMVLFLIDSAVGLLSAPVSPEVLAGAGEAAG